MNIGILRQTDIQTVQRTTDVTNEQTRTNSNR